MRLRSPSHDQEIQDRAKAIFSFLKEGLHDIEGAEAYLDREELLLYLKAFKSRYFMRLVEDDPTLPYDLKMQVSHMISGLAKTWPAANKMIYDDSALRFAAVAWRMSAMFNRVINAIGIRVILQGTATEEIQPEELPPGARE